jgi:hypothetical protein
MTFNDYIRKIETNIAHKKGLNIDKSGVDKEIIAWISVYRHGAETYKIRAKKILLGILVNSGLVKNKKELENDRKNI